MPIEYLLKRIFKSNNRHPARPQRSHLCTANLGATAVQACKCRQVGKRRTQRHVRASTHVQLCHRGRERCERRVAHLGVTAGQRGQSGQVGKRRARRYTATPIHKQGIIFKLGQTTTGKKVSNDVLTAGSLRARLVVGAHSFADARARFVFVCFGFASGFTVLFFAST